MRPVWRLEINQQARARENDTSDLEGSRSESMSEWPQFRKGWIDGLPSKAKYGREDKHEAIRLFLFSYEL